MTAFGWGSRNLAIGALGINVAAIGIVGLMVGLIDYVPYAVAELFYETSNTVARFTTVGTLIGALGFLPWLSKTYARAMIVAHTPALEEQQRRGPVTGFFIPFVNFVRPYSAVKALDDALDPDRVPVAAPRLVPDGPATYRDAPLESFERRAAPSAPVALWWGLWIARAVGGIATKSTQSNLLIAAWDLLVSVCALSACLVVWRISARLAEVERRQGAIAAHEG